MIVSGEIVKPNVLIGTQLNKVVFSVTIHEFFWID